MGCCPSRDKRRPDRVELRNAEVGEVTTEFRSKASNAKEPGRRTPRSGARLGIA